jgi:hypothetical protein
VLHQDRFPAIEKIRFSLMAAGDLGPWLSERTRKSKMDHNADMMFNDWQIVHFHLGDFFQSAKAIRRTKELLFVHITAEEATLLDVEMHGAWTKTELLEILLRTNPPALERYEAHAVTGVRFSDDKYRELRGGRTNSMIAIAGRAFMPGMGLFSSGHATRLWAYKTWFFKKIEEIKREFEADIVDRYLKPAIYQRLGIPVRLGAWYNDEGLAIIDKNRNGLVLHKMKPLE